MPGTMEEQHVDINEASHVVNGRYVRRCFVAISTIYEYGLSAMLREQH